MLSMTQPMDRKLTTSAALDEESQLLARWRDNGDRLALDRLAERLVDLAWRVARSICARPQDAEDAVQDAFVQLVTKGRQWRSEAPARAWMAVVTANAARRRLRTEAGRTRAQSDLPPPSAEA